MSIFAVGSIKPENFRNQEQNYLHPKIDCILISKFSQLSVVRTLAISIVLNTFNSHKN